MTTGGLRKGEKLYEEKLMSEEGIRTTSNKLIFIGRPIPFDTDEFLRRLEGLMTAAYDGREDIIRDLVAQVVTTFKPVTVDRRVERVVPPEDQMPVIAQGDPLDEIAVANGKA